VRNTEETNGLIHAPTSLRRINAAKPEPQLEILAHRSAKKHLLLEHIREMAGWTAARSIERDLP
jgi:hypothetical protein